MKSQIFSLSLAKYLCIWLIFLGNWLKTKLYATPLLDQNIAVDPKSQHQFEPAFPKGPISIQTNYIFMCE